MESSAPFLHCFFTKLCFSLTLISQANSRVSLSTFTRYFLCNVDEGRCLRRKTRRNMAKCHRNDVGSLVLKNRVTDSGSHRIWTSFCGSAFRRKIFDAMRCGGGSHHRRHHNAVSDVIASTEAKKTQEQSRSEKSEKSENFEGSEKLSVLLNLAEAVESGVSDECSEVDVKKRTEALEELMRAVKRLQVDDDGERSVAASDVRRLAKEDSEARTTLAMLGAIPPLIQMLDCDDLVSQISALYALLNLGIGNDVNKAAIVKAGAVHKMLKLIQSPSESHPNPSVAEAIVANFLGLSALDLNKPIIGSSGAIPFLVKILKNIDNSSSVQAKQDSLRALYNLSISPSNTTTIIESELVTFLLHTLGDMEVSERILSILSNIVATTEGRKSISIVPDAFPILIDVLNWTDSPSCQEKASYILMVMAHKAYGDRHAMIDSGIVFALLELTLLGSTLAQKRASRILDCLRVDKGKQVSESYCGSLSAAVSAPICGSSSSPSVINPNLKDCVEEEDMMSEERKAVKQLVQQSLQSNMRRIVKRANLPQDFVPSDHFKSLALSSTSKSLPF